MIAADEKIYSGTALSSITSSIMSFKATTTGILRTISLYGIPGGFSGNWFFNIRLAGTPLFSGASRLLFNGTQSSDQKISQTFTVNKGDAVALDLEAVGTGSLLTPIILLLETEVPAKDFTFTTASLANNGVENGTIVIARTFKIKKVTLDKAARIRLYKTAAARSADSARNFGDLSYYGTEHKIICDLLLNGSTGLDWDMSPDADGSNADSPTSANIYYSVQNLSGSSGTVTPIINALVVEN